MNKGKMNLR